MRKYVQVIDSMKAIAMRSDQLQRDLRGQKMSMKDRWKLLEQDYQKPFEERLELYACEEAKKEFEEAKTEYPDYSYTEWSPAF